MVSRGPRHDSRRVAIPVSLLLALVLNVIALPSWAVPFRPDFVALVLIYWCLMAPGAVGVGVGWLTGLAMDVMQATLLGHHALAKAVIAYLAGRFHLRIRMFPWWQQSLVVLVLLVVDSALVAWLHGMAEGYGVGWWYWVPPLAGMVAWPIVYAALRDGRHRGQLA